MLGRAMNSANTDLINLNCDIKGTDGPILDPEDSRDPHFHYPAECFDIHHLNRTLGVLI